MCTSLRVQAIARTWEGPSTYVDVIGMCKVAGYTFCIHQAIGCRGFTATYAPVGLGGGVYGTPEQAIAHLESNAEQTKSAVEYAMRRMGESNQPLYSGEYGIESVDWQWREQQRLDNGDYLPVPKVGGLVYPKDHYLHLSKLEGDSSDLVAYTPTAEHGSQDRQVRLKFGRYLKKTFPDLTDCQIQTAVMELKAALRIKESPMELKFATDTETINEIFETEMFACDSRYVSCMHGKFQGSSSRPYHVYADSPDVAVAYITKGGHIQARSVVSTRFKNWVRPYSISSGDSTLCHVLITMLTEAGYSEGDLTDNRLTNLGDGCLPYIDHGGMGVRDDGKYWIVCDENEGDYNCDQTDGTATEVRHRCSRCSQPEDDCECIYCNCCRESFADGCDDCHMCTECNRCSTHDRCTCDPEEESEEESEETEESTA